MGKGAHEENKSLFGHIRYFCPVRRQESRKEALTQEFFDQSQALDLFVSDMVIAEIEGTRTMLLRDSLRDFADRFDSLPIRVESRRLAEEYMKQGAIPSDYPEDALHIAIAILNEMDYLLSWNFRHIVRARTRRIVNAVNLLQGYPEIQVLSPPEVL